MLMMPVMMPMLSLLGPLLIPLLMPLLTLLHLILKFACHHRARQAAHDSTQLPAHELLS